MRQLLPVLVLLLASCAPAAPATTGPDQGAEHEPAGVSLSPQPAASPLPSPSPVTGGTVTTYFQGQGPGTALLDVLDGARTSIDMAIYALTLPSVAQSLVRAAGRGVQVRMIVDQSELASSNPAMATLVRSICAAGVPVRKNVPRGYQIMHQKMSVVDRAIGTTGSFNYTVSAATSNWEMLVIVRNAAIARQWTAAFEALLADTAHFTDACGPLATPSPTPA